MTKIISGVLVLCVFLCFCTKNSAMLRALFVFKPFRAPILAKKADRGLDRYARFGGRDFRYDRIVFGWELQFAQKDLIVEVHMPLPVKNYPRSKLLPGLPTFIQFYTIAEVAIILETKVGSVHEWIQEGLLLAVQFRS